MEKEEKELIETSIRALSKKHDVKIEKAQKNIVVLKEKVYSKKSKELIHNPAKRHDLGNKSWGKIDYLSSHGFKVIEVSKFKH